MRYSDVSLALEGLADIVVNYRNSSNNAGYGWVVDVKAGVGTRFGVPNYIGVFNMQSRYARYSPLSQILEQTWTCGTDQGIAVT